MNARIQKAVGNQEEKHIREYTLEPETAQRNRSDMVQSNGRRLIDICHGQGLKVRNTMFRKEKIN